MAEGSDFLIDVARDGDMYRVQVRSPDGVDLTRQAEIDLSSPLSGLQLGGEVAASSPPRDLEPTSAELESPLRQFGTELFDRVLGDQGGTLLVTSRSQAERAGGRLRVLLRVPPELAKLPWELLYHSGYGGYVCRRSPVVRYVTAFEPVRPLVVTPPLRVLGMTALPGTLAALESDAERARLTEALEPLRRQGLVTLHWVPGETWEDLQKSLYLGCHLFHFIGHGGFDHQRGEGTIILADAAGRPRAVPASALAELLSVAAPGPHLVVLNSCRTATGLAGDAFSSAAASLVSRIPAVVAMQFSITDGAARVFSGAFYEALAHNRGVDEAVRHGRIALAGWDADTMEWVTPVLYMRSGDRYLLTVTDTATTLAAPKRQTTSAGTFDRSPGRIKLEFVRRLGHDWTDLADVLDVPAFASARFRPGDEPRGLWEWIEIRGGLQELPDRLDEIGRADLAQLLRSGTF
jgi:hypothetical protein